MYTILFKIMLLIGTVEPTDLENTYYYNYYEYVSEKQIIECVITGKIENYE